MTDVPLGTVEATIVDAAEDVVESGERVGDFTTLSQLQEKVLVPLWAFNALKAAVEARHG